VAWLQHNDERPTIPGHHGPGSAIEWIQALDACVSESVFVAADQNEVVNVAICSNPGDFGCAFPAAITFSPGPARWSASISSVKARQAFMLVYQHIPG